MTELIGWELLIAATVIQFLFGIAITALSYTAYHLSARATIFKLSTIGFLLVSVGGILAPIYELGIKGDFTITAQELLVLQILEGTVIALGLGLLLLAVYSYGRPEKRVQAEPVSELADFRDDDKT